MRLPEEDQLINTSAHSQLHPKRLMRSTCDDNLAHSTILFSNPTTEQLVQRSVGAWPFSNTLLPHPAGWTGTGAFLHRGHI